MGSLPSMTPTAPAPPVAFVPNAPRSCLLLAWTSAKNFLLYETQLRQRSIAIEDRLHRITVVNRGSWGEVRFRLHD